MKVIRSVIIVVATSILMLIAFTLPWSLWVVQRQPEAGEDWLFHFLGQLVWFGVYLFPLAVIVALLTVMPSDLCLASGNRKRWLRFSALGWVATALVAFLAVPIWNNPRVALGATACSAVACGLAIVAHRFLSPSIP
jgi:hypothetical protein